MATATDLQSLELRIAAAKDSYAVGERVALTLELRNTGSSPLKVPKFFLLPADAPGKNTLEIRVHDAAGRRLTRISHMLTGRALYQPQLVSLDAGAVYAELLPIAGSYTRKQGRKKIERALWSLGEEPLAASANEYPEMAPGTYRVEAVYHVEAAHLISLDEAERRAVWQGELASNTLMVRLEPAGRP